jgi:hypothetical protein
MEHALSDIAGPVFIAAFFQAQVLGLGMVLGFLLSLVLWRASYYLVIPVVIALQVLVIMAVGGVVGGSNALIVEGWAALAGVLIDAAFAWYLVRLGRR